jgi:hypothetical protein
MFVQYAFVLELLQGPTSPNYEDSKKKRLEQNVLLIYKYLSIIADKSAEPLGTREISPKVPREPWREICCAKGKQIPGQGKL